MEDERPASELGLLPSITLIERQAFDDAALDQAMAHPDAVVQRTRRNLGGLTAKGYPEEMVAVDAAATGGALCQPQRLLPGGPARSPWMTGHALDATNRHRGPFGRVALPTIARVALGFMTGL